MEQLRIDLVPMGVTPNAHASQFDVGRVIRFLLYNGGTAYTLAGTETITVKMAKPDGTEETVNVTNTSSNYVDFVTTDGLLNQAGLYPCEISITSGTDVIGSKNFNLRVELDPYDGHNIKTVTVGPADICTFNTDLPEFFPSVTVNVVATGGNGTPDNPNPINGYSSANITRCGVNLWNEVWENGDISSTTGEKTTGSLVITKNFIPVKPNTTYYSTMTLRTRWYDAQKNYIGTDPTIPANATFVVPSNAYYVMFTTQAGYGSTYNNDISINYPSTDHDYHAYNGQTYAISFGQTVYGGVLDVTRGKLTVTHGYALIDGVNLYGEYYYGDMVIRPDNVILATTDFTKWKCNIFTPSVSTIGYNTNQNFMFLRQATWESTGATDAATFNTYCQNTPIQVVYELATPFDIDLTPVQIRALVGENNVFADCGETTVEYMAEGT